jgi:hypothetical protein
MCNLSHERAGRAGSFETRHFASPSLVLSAPERRARIANAERCAERLRAETGPPCRGQRSVATVRGTRPRHDRRSDSKGAADRPRRRFRRVVAVNSALWCAASTPPVTPSWPHCPTRHAPIGYLFTGGTAVARPGLVEGPGGTLPHRLPTCGCGSLFARGLAGFRLAGGGSGGSARLEVALPSRRSMVLDGPPGAGWTSRRTRRPRSWPRWPSGSMARSPH